MPDLFFDGKRIAVPAGTNLVEAGLQAGVPVPVFCYQKDLGAVGACRVCAVTATRKGKSRLVMACMTEAEEGMEVATTDPESVSFRKHVIEWLMIHHPHDCPICDEGGECQLQDLTIACGHSQRRYHGPKRTFDNQYLGEFIVHEMNRCITCYRCSRFYQDYAGGRDFAASGSRDRVYFGRFEEGPLESPFSGNLVEMCPTGVFTDKLFRYRSRVWDLEVAPSICPHCSVGCNVLPGVRYRELQRVRVRDNPAVNGVFLCDRGQFGHGWVMDPARPGRPEMRGEPGSWDDVLGLAAGSLIGVAQAHGASAVALISSPRASLETHAALEGLAVGPLAGVRVSHFDDPDRELRALGALSALGAAGARPLDQADLAGCDALLVAGASLVDEAPLAALGARQAARRGGRLFVLGPVERYLNDVAEDVLASHPADLARWLNEIADRLRPSSGPDRAGKRKVDLDGVSRVADALRAARRPGVLLGSDLLDGAAIAAGLEISRALGGEARLGYLFPGPNGFGAALLSRGATLGSILDGIERGEVRAAVLVESDLADLGPAVLDSLGRLELLVVADHVRSELCSLAHAVLPTTANYESEGLFVSRAGRIQAFISARVPGVPVTRLIENETFPRQPRPVPPQSEARPAWWALERLREWAIGRPPPRDLAALRQALSILPALASLKEVRPGAAGAPIDWTKLSLDAPEIASFRAVKGRLSLFRLDRTLGSESLSRRSEPMRRMAGPPVARIASSDAAALDLTGPVAIECAGHSVELAVAADPTVPPGLILIPRDVVWPARIPQGAEARVHALAVEEGRP